MVFSWPSWSLCCFRNAFALDGRREVFGRGQGEGEVRAATYGGLANTRKSSERQDDQGNTRLSILSDDPRVGALQQENAICLRIDIHVRV